MTEVRSVFWLIRRFLK